jgi:GTP-binding protein
MLPTLVIVGRPNVGKSTLFNRLTRSRAALVADFPGLTRDRHYGRGRSGERSFLVVDTGGFEPVAKDGILFEMAKQTHQAIAEADVVVFIVDARAGLTRQDRDIADLLRRSGRPVVVAANKAEGLAPASAALEFHELGLGEPHPVSAAHGDNVDALAELALSLVPAETADSPEREDRDAIKVAVIGRPNVGKSTLVNTLLGEERMIAYGEPGTTRDSIYIDFERNGRRYTLIDTAGVRRRGKVFEAVEKFSVIKTLQAIDDAHVVILLFDAAQGVSEQDAHLAGYILEAGRALVVAVNKWDAVPAAEREQVKRELDRKAGFLAFARPPLHLGKGSTGYQRVAPLGRRGVRRCDGEALDAEALANAGRRRASPAAASRRNGSAEAALRAPGRPESAAHRHPWVGARQHPGDLPPLPGTFLQRGVPTARNPP